MADTFIFDDDETPPDAGTPDPVAPGPDKPEGGEGSNRNFLIAAIILGGIVLLSLIFMAVYALVIMPAQKSSTQATSDANSAANTQVVLNQQQTQAASLFTPTPAPTETIVYAPEPTLTLVVVFSSPTPSAVPTIDPFVITQSANQTALAGLKGNTKDATGTSTNKPKPSITASSTRKPTSTKKPTSTIAASSTRKPTLTITVSSTKKPTATTSSTAKPKPSVTASSTQQPKPIAIASSTKTPKPSATVLAAASITQKPKPTATVISITKAKQPATATVTDKIQPSFSATPVNDQLAHTGFADEYGLPGLLFAAVLLIAVIMLSRRLRQTIR